MAGRHWLRAAILLPGLALSSMAPGPAEDFRVALAGDAILNRRLSVYDDPAYTALFERVRRADAAFANLETLIPDPGTPGGFESGGAYQSSPPWIVDELKWAGFDLLGVANNHTFDYGVD